MQIARQTPGISDIPGGNRQPAVRRTFAAPLNAVALEQTALWHCVNLDIFGRGTIFAREGEFS
ncbi:hypothetical protein EB233_17285 [Mesorhizobium erdmanii]|uniref:Uncharacterized protein n=1 Tax=Mesorhizobium erdmanii TaxID=1777866 RepID=A0A6M7UGA3_9HYPH|nr:hypothetical protein A8146_03930 [Mesorhizobium loti]QKC77049.1 hypothetical protein EB233_17285 [Mesorhizobium erdmanii]